MYESHFGLKKKPFLNAFDGEFFYSSRAHEEAMARCRYAAGEGRGAAALTGPAGTGKTFVASMLAREWAAAGIPVVHLRHACLSREEFVRVLLAGLGGGMDDTGSFSALEDRLAELPATGRRAVLILDDAHLQDLAVFSAVRGLLNLQAGGGLAVTVLLAGNETLWPRLRAAQIDGRVDISFRLTALQADEIAPYVERRLRAAGAAGPLFAPDAFEPIGAWSGGIPARINRLCDTALFATYGEGAQMVDVNRVRRAIEDLEGSGPRE